MKKIIIGIVIFVVCVGTIVFSIFNNKDTKQVLKQSDNNVKVEEVSNNENSYTGKYLKEYLFKK